MCIPKSNHKKLIEDCYPPPKALATSGPEYRPNSNELSRLAYYGTNKPAKLAKVGVVLEARASSDARAAKGTGLAADKGKAGLLITLAITKNLLTECKAHLNYFIKSAQSIIGSALDATSTSASSRPRDLEISARAASTFYALTSYLDPSTMSVDDDFKKLLKGFAAMAVERPVGVGVDQVGGEDVEQRNRTRLIGMGALAGAVGSDAIYTSNFSSYSAVIVPALLENIKDNRVTLDWLGSESKKASDGEPSYSEFSVKRMPLAVRRAPSISGHVDGEKGPSTENVISAAMGTLQGLLRHGDAGHVQVAISHSILWLDGKSALAIPPPIDGRQAKLAWENIDWCCWLSQAICSWTSLQYRFVVLISYVEHLIDVCEGQATTKHLSLIEMAKSMLTGQLSLIGLSTSDMLSSLVGLAVRRVYKDTRDSLLPPLVDCISGLGTHIYYADQINDIADEIAARIATLQMPDANVGSAEAAGSTKGHADINTHLLRQRMANAGPEQRDESIRVLLFSLMGVLRSAHKSSGEVQKAIDEKAATSTTTEVDEKGKTAVSDGIGLGRAGTRNRVSPSVMLPTAGLLASSNHAVRLAYLQTLITLFRDEFEREQSKDGATGLGGSLATTSERVEESIGFIHALSAAIHVMALSKSLVVPSALTNNLRESPLELLPQLERINLDPGRPGSLNSDSVSGVGAGSESTAALPVDYTATAKALEELITALPSVAALGLTPMLLALDKDAGNRLVVNGAGAAGLENQRRVASRLIAARALDKLGQTLSIPSISSSAQSTLSQIPSLGVELGPTPPEGLTMPPEVVPFSVVQGINGAGDSSSSSSPIATRSTVIDGLANSKSLQTSTGLDATTMKKWLERDWNVGIAVDESFAGSSPTTSSPGLTPSRRPSYTPVAPVKVNGSIASIGATGVSDFREALQTPNGNGALNVADRRASRRESRRVASAATPVPGVNLLDSLQVGVKDDSTATSTPIVPPYPG